MVALGLLLFYSVYRQTILHVVGQTMVAKTYLNKCGNYRNPRKLPDKHVEIYCSINVFLESHFEWFFFILGIMEEGFDDIWNGDCFASFQNKGKPAFEKRDRKEEMSESIYFPLFVGPWDWGNKEINSQAMWSFGSCSNQDQGIDCLRLFISFEASLRYD